MVCVVQGVLGLGFSVLSAVAGLVDQPMQSLLDENGVTATGIVAGFGRGMLGVIAKPVGGAMELLHSTSQVGLKKGKGVWGLG